MIHLLSLFFSKIIDKSLYTAQVMFVQRNKAILAAISIALSDFVYLTVVKNVVADNTIVSTIVVAIAGGVGCYIALKVGDKFSKEKLFINVILGDDVNEMRKFAEYLRDNDIHYSATDAYNKAMTDKTIAITAYAETKNDSHLISQYIRDSSYKFKRILKT